jgi:hypothetical protein
VTKGAPPNLNSSFSTLERIERRKIPPSQLELLAKWLDTEPEETILTPEPDKPHED